MVSNLNQKLENQFFQIESLLAIYRLLPNMRFLPETRGWAGSPDFLKKIAEVILKEKPRFVLELGGGASSIVLGASLKENKFGFAISLDHENSYLEQTRGNLALNEIGESIDITYSPLKDYQLYDTNWKWYDYNFSSLHSKIDILIIDGPPGKTQKLARFPAVPLLMKYFNEKVILLLDDANRADEKVIVDKWIELLELHDFSVLTSNYHHFEKGLVLMEITRVSNA